MLTRDGSKQTFAAWRVRCVCGTEKTLTSRTLISGGAKSCGCNKAEAQRARATRHGLTHTPTWNSWCAMRQRCSNPTDPSYHRYGGRGIRVCARWDDSFEAVFEDMGLRPGLSHSIDRKDVNGNYEPGACRWATVREQALNRRSNRRFTYAGRSQTLSEWAKETGFGRNTIAQRLNAGWPIHDALTRKSSRGERLHPIVRRQGVHGGFLPEIR